MSARTSKPNVLIAHWKGLEVFSDADLDLLAEVATIVDRDPVDRWDDSRAERLLADTEVVLGHWGCPRLDSAMLERAPRLELFAYAAGTVKAALSSEVFDRGITVTSGGDANAEPVAEFTLAAVLWANKDVMWRRDVLRDPSCWTQRQEGTVPVGNWDKRIGIVGASLIGRRVIELLRPFPHLPVAVYDPFLSTEEAVELGVEKQDLHELCAGVDVLSIHAPDLPATQKMIGADQLAALRTGATVINTARSALVDQDALVSEVAAGRLYAVLDVTDPEPLPVDHVLYQLPNAFVTPHLAGTEGTELRRMAEYAIEEVRRWSAGERARNPVSRERLERMA